MLRNGQQQINLNQANNVSVFPSCYQKIPGQSIMMSANGVPCHVQPVYNLQPNIQQNSITPQAPQQQTHKNPLKHFANFSPSGTKNADDMIKSIIFDPNSLITETPKKPVVMRPAFEAADICNNNSVINMSHFGFHNFNVITNKGVVFPQMQNPVNISTAAAQVGDEDDFGDFIGVDVKTGGASPSVGNAPRVNPQPQHLFSPVLPFAPETESSEVSKTIDNLSLYGIQMPKWITNDRVVPDVYKKVLHSVTRNGTIDTGLLHSELLKSGLPRQVLGHLWEMCSKKVRGAMDRSELYLMLAMISICQNKLGCSSLHTLTKCLQAPIPKLDFIDIMVPDCKQSLPRQSSTSLSSPSYAKEVYATPDNGTMCISTINTDKDGLACSISSPINNNKSTSQLTNIPHMLSSNCYTNRSVDKVVSEDNDHSLHHPGKSCYQNEANFISNNENDDDDDEFDDFQSAPTLPNKSPPKPVVRSTLSSSSSYSSTSLLSPPPRVVARKTPTLLSLASPVLANIPSCAFPPVVVSSESQLSSAPPTLPSPDLMSDEICEDKYAAFRQLQSATTMTSFGDDQDVKKNIKDDIDDFGEFESGLPVGAPMPSLKFPSTDVFYSDLLSFNSSIPSTILSSKAHNVNTRIIANKTVDIEDDFADFPISHFQPRNDKMIIKYDKCTTISDHRLPLDRSTSRIVGSTHFEELSHQKQHQNQRQDCKSKNDWSDFLGLDSHPQCATFANEDDGDDDFDGFVSHKKVSQATILNVDFTPRCGTSFNAIDLSHNPHDKETKLNNIFNDALPMDNKKDGGLTPCNAWNSPVDQLEDEPQTARKMNNDDDDISFRSLEFKVSKPLSSNQTPDDSRSTSSDQEKKSADERSISSFDLFPSNDSNITSSGNSLANNTMDPSPNFLINPGKPLDAKEILNKMGGVIAADRYYGLADHTQDPDSHAYQWLRCLNVVDSMMKQANEVFSDAKEENLIRELLKAEKGIIYLKGLAGMFLVAARISYQMKISSILSEDLKRLQKSIDDKWQELSTTIPEDISSLFLPSITLTLVDSNPMFQRQQMEPKGLDAYRSSCGLCLLCVNASPMYASNNSQQDRLDYGGRAYHPQCANLWINCIDLTLPSLNIPELL